MVSRTWSVRSKTPSEVSRSAIVVGSSQGGSAAVRILRGFVRELWSIVPPVRSMVRVLIAVEDAHVLGIRLRAAPLVGQPLPASPDADDLVAELGRAVDDALDDRVEARARRRRR